MLASPTLYPYIPPHPREISDSRMATPGYCSAEQSAAIKGKKVLILSHSKWNPAGLPAAAVQNIKSYNGFFIENGAECYLATPNATDDLVYLAYKDNDLISGAIAAPEMYGNNGSQAIADAVKAAGIKFGMWVGVKSGLF